MLARLDAFPPKALAQTIPSRLPRPQYDQSAHVSARFGADSIPAFGFQPLAAPVQTKDQSKPRPCCDHPPECTHYFAEVPRSNARLKGSNFFPYLVIRVIRPRAARRPAPRDQTVKARQRASTPMLTTKTLSGFRSYRNPARMGVRIKARLLIVSTKPNASPT